MPGETPPCPSSPALPPATHPVKFRHLIWGLLSCPGVAHPAPALRGDSKSGWRQQLRSQRVRRGRADSKFQGKAAFAEADIPALVEGTDLLPPSAPTSPPGSTGVCSAGRNHLLQARAPACSPAKRLSAAWHCCQPSQELWGHLPSGRDGANQQQPGSFCDPCSASQSCRHRDTKEAKAGLLKPWALAAVPAGPISEGAGSREPLRASLHSIQHLL